MDFSSLNWLAILACGLNSMASGSHWYIFGGSPCLSR